MAQPLVHVRDQRLREVLPGDPHEAHGLDLRETR